VVHQLIGDQHAFTISFHLDEGVRIAAEHDSTLPNFLNGRSPLRVNMEKCIEGANQDDCTPLYINQVPIDCTPVARTADHGSLDCPSSPPEHPFYNIVCSVSDPSILEVICAFRLPTRYNESFERDDLFLISLFSRKVHTPQLNLKSAQEASEVRAERSREQILDHLEDYIFSKFSEQYRFELTRSAGKTKLKAYLPFRLNDGGAISFSEYAFDFLQIGETDIETNGDELKAIAKLPYKVAFLKKSQRSTKKTRVKSGDLHCALAEDQKGLDCEGETSDFKLWNKFQAGEFNKAKVFAKKQRFIRDNDEESVSERSLLTSLINVHARTELNKEERLAVENGKDIFPEKKPLSTATEFEVPQHLISDDESNDTDADGVSDDEDSCPETETGTAVDEDGCALESDDEEVSKAVSCLDTTKQRLHYEFGLENADSLGETNCDTGAKSVVTDDIPAKGAGGCSLTSASEKDDFMCSLAVIGLLFLLGVRIAMSGGKMKKRKLHYTSFWKSFLLVLISLSSFACAQDILSQDPADYVMTLEQTEDADIITLSFELAPVKVYSKDGISEIEEYNFLRMLDRVQTIDGKSIRGDLDRAVKAADLQAHFYREKKLESRIGSFASASTCTSKNLELGKVMCTVTMPAGTFESEEGQEAQWMQMRSLKEVVTLNGGTTQKMIQNFTTAFIDVSSTRDPDADGFVGSFDLCPNDPELFLKDNGEFVLDADTGERVPADGIPDGCPNSQPEECAAGEADCSTTKTPPTGGGSVSGGGASGGACSLVQASEKSSSCLVFLLFFALAVLVGVRRAEE